MTTKDPFGSQDAVDVWTVDAYTWFDGFYHCPLSLSNLFNASLICLISCHSSVSLGNEKPDFLLTPCALDVIYRICSKPT